MLDGRRTQTAYDGAGALLPHCIAGYVTQLLTFASALQVVSRLTALKAWDTDGRLERLAREKAAPEPAAPVKAAFSNSVRAAVRTSGSQATPALSAGELVRARCASVMVTCVEPFTDA